MEEKHNEPTGEKFSLKNENKPGGWTAGVEILLTPPQMLLNHSDARMSWQKEKVTGEACL